MRRIISDDDVASIIKIAENLDMTQWEIADAFNISQGHVSRILARQRRVKKAVVQ